MLWPVALSAGVLLIAVSLFPHEKSWLAAVLLLLGQLSLTLLMALVINGSTPGPRSGSSGIFVANGLSMVLLVVLLLAYYAVYQIKLPYANTVLETATTVIVAVCGLAASREQTRERETMSRPWLAPAFLCLLLVLPLAQLAVWQAPKTTQGNGLSVRIMSYNLHSGFSAQGGLALDALAQVIEKANPDIVALQEVSRGWLVNGRTDMLSFLSHRLDLPYAFGPTADPFWGNAILSRYPILSYENHELPPRNLFILRGFTSAVIDIGGGERLNLIATHLDHLAADSAIRVTQTEAIVSFWGGQQDTVILGDMNAEPDSPEISQFIQAGLSDSLASKAPASVYTFNSANLYQRIDYIWLSPDLKALDSYVIPNKASDHRPVIALVGQ